MLRLHKIAFAGWAALLASTAGAFAQTARGEQCVPSVEDMSLYDNCRLVTLQKGMFCRCNVRSQAARQSPMRLTSRQDVAHRLNRGVAMAAPASMQPITMLKRDDERALTASELNQIYSGRTWIWSDGGGYFEPNGSFYAAVGSTAATAFLARGTWTAGDQGELCFQALWNGQSGKNVEKTCFYHKVANGSILQKKGQDGEWYTFRNPRLDRMDEFRKIILGNRISDKMSDIRSRYLYGTFM